VDVLSFIGFDEQSKCGTLLVEVISSQNFVFFIKVKTGENDSHLVKTSGRFIAII